MKLHRIRVLGLEEEKAGWRPGGLERMRKFEKWYIEHIRPYRYKDGEEMITSKEVHTKFAEYLKQEAQYAAERTENG